MQKFYFTAVFFFIVATFFLNEAFGKENGATSGQIPKNYLPSDNSQNEFIGIWKECIYCGMFTYCDIYDDCCKWCLWRKDDSCYVNDDFSYFDPQVQTVNCQWKWKHRKCRCCFDNWKINPYYLQWQDDDYQIESKYFEFFQMTPIGDDYRNGNQGL